jgi:hypothetical protein
MSRTYRYSGDNGCVVGCLLILLFLALFLAISGLSALVLMFAWNLVLPPLLGWPVMTYPTAFGLSLLLGIIGNPFRGGRSSN